MIEKTSEQALTDVEVSNDTDDASPSSASGNGSKARGRFLLLCGHPPHHDPRILYMADSLSRLGDVTIIFCADYGKKDPNSLVYKKHSCRSYRAAKGRSLISLVRSYWHWFNPRNLPVLTAIVRTWWKRRFGPPVGHLHDVTLGFLPFYARVLTNRDFDHIVCCDSYAMEGAVIAKVLQPGSRLVFDAHEVFYSEFNQDVDREKMLRKIEEKWLRHVDRLFVVSKGIQALYLKRNPHLKGRVHCLPNAIPFCGIKENEIVANTSGTVRFIFQGGYSRTRGIDRLLEIWAALSACNASLTLRMVGYTCDELATLKTLVASGGGRNAVIFDQPVKEDDLVRACVGYDVGVIPYLPEVSLSHLNCCPNKFGQYLNSGCAVLTTDSRYLRRLVKDMECGWFYDPNNIKASAELIEGIVADRRALHEKRMRALHHAEHTYNWDIMDRIVESVIKK